MCKIGMVQLDSNSSDDNISSQTFNDAFDLQDSRKRRVTSNLTNESLECKRFRSFHSVEDPSPPQKHARSEIKDESDTNGSFSMGTSDNGSDKLNVVRKKNKRTVNKSSAEDKLTPSDNSKLILTLTSDLSQPKSTVAENSNASSAVISSLSYESMATTSSSPITNEGTEEREKKKSKFEFTSPTFKSQNENGVVNAFKLKSTVNNDEDDDTLINPYAFNKPYEQYINSNSNNNNLNSFDCNYDGKYMYRVSRNEDLSEATSMDASIETNDTTERKKTKKEKEKKHSCNGGCSCINCEVDGDIAVTVDGEDVIEKGEGEGERESTEFVLSSGRANKNAEPNRKFVTIDDEFDQYFSKLLL